MSAAARPAPVPLPRVGVLVLMVEKVGDHLVIKVTVNHNVNRELYSARPEPPRTVADVHAALDIATAFLRSFEPQP
jgi:hypothetical protein